ncbi:S-layer homology domain-containing protein [Paenibacillus chartarius]|uniref:S-layer homology domain-containing protein n=1 Tax=Paenibacillus chartarius TaxID=747481 RepID=A0ABV6DLZ3_9BACL
MKRYLPMKKLLAATLALSLAIGTGTTAFAKDGKGNNKDNDHDNGRHLGQIKLDFKDLQSSDFEWALRYIAELASRRVFEGYSDGTFRPNESVSRIEAITAAVRVMGLREKAESAEEMQTKLNFKDAALVPAWAVGYVAVAVENGLFSETDSFVNPQQPADRLWATTLLVKALKLQQEAEANMNATLPFKDAKSIPAGSVGYVKVAIDKKLVDGFEDNTFRPNQPVTRAQIAALLTRAGEQLPGNADGLYTGTVSAPVSGSVLAVSQNGQTTSLTLDANAFIYRNGAKVGSSQLQVGDVVRVRVYNNLVIFVEVTRAAGTNQNPNPVPAAGVRNGTVAAAVNGGVLTLLSGGTTVALPVNGNALYFRGGTQVGASSLQVGDVVTTRSYNNAVVYVEVTQPVGSTSTPSYSRSFTATVTAPASGGTITYVADGQQGVMSLSSGAFIYRSGVQTDASALQAGDVVTVYAYNNTAAVVEVRQTASTVPATGKGDLSGTVVGYAQNNVIAVKSGDKTYKLTFHANAFVYRGGVQTAAGALRPGDTVTFRYVNGVVLIAEVTKEAGGANSAQPGVAQHSGQFVSAANGMLTFISGTQTVSLQRHTNSFFLRGGQVVSADALQAGDIITARVYNNFVILTEVTSMSNSQSSVVSGTFQSSTLNNSGKIATIAIIKSGESATTVYQAASNVTITGNTGNLVQNRPVVLQVTNNVVTGIIIQ